MNVIFDLILIGIVGLCIWRGYTKGFILSAAGVLALILAIYCANLSAGMFSEHAASSLRPLVSGFVDDAFSKQERETEGLEEGALEDLAKNNPDAAYSLSAESFKTLGLFPEAAEKLAQKVALNTREYGMKLKEAMIEALCENLSHIIVFSVSFLILLIAFQIIAKLIDAVFKLPGLNLVNRVGGLALGLLKGLIFAFVLAWLAQYMGILTSDGPLENTILLKWLMRINPISAIMDI